MPFMGIIIAMLFTSCLKKGLPELPLADGNAITLVNAEYRFESGAKNMNGQSIVTNRTLTVVQGNIDKVNGIINVAISVPAAGSPVDFTAAEKAKVVQTKIWFNVNLSTAATISPTGGTPALGDPTDATKPLKYVVTAANGDVKVWTINVTSFSNN